MRILLGRNKIRFLHKIGEGIFDGVYRSSVIVILSVQNSTVEDYYWSVILNKSNRQELGLGLVSLDSLVADHGGERLIDDGWVHGSYKLKLGKTTKEENILSTMQKNTIAWDDICFDFRGVELSQKGTVVLCSMCNTANSMPKKRKGEFDSKNCSVCGSMLKLDVEHITDIITPNMPAHDDYREFLRGEDVNRYQIKPTMYIELGVPGINYKPEGIYTSPKLLIRKTGFGIYASIDYTNSIVPQVVYIFKKRTSTIKYGLEYLLGIINSRLILYHYIHSSGESEWKSFPYITQKIVKQIPIPKIDWADRQQVIIHDTIVDLVRKISKSYDKKIDYEIEKLVWAMFDVPYADHYMNVEKYLIGHVQHLRIIREMFYDE